MAAWRETSESVAELKFRRDIADQEIDRILDQGVTSVWRRDALRHAEQMFRRADHAWRSALNDAGMECARVQQPSPSPRATGLASGEGNDPGLHAASLSAAPLAAQPDPPAPPTLWDERNEAA